MKNETVEGLLSKPWSWEFVPEDGLISAWVTELPGCFATGTTWEEAHTNLEDALVAWLTAAVELGNDVPEPRGDEEPDEHSGRFSVRVPRYIHRPTGESGGRGGLLPQPVGGNSARGVCP